MTDEQHGGLAAILMPSRAQAIKDGYLVEPFNVTDEEGEISVALTLGAAFDLFVWDDDEQEAQGLTEEHRLDIGRRRLSKCAGVACIALDKWRSEGEPSEFRVLSVVQRGPAWDGGPELRSASVDVEVHRGDHGETVITMSRSGERR